MSELNWMKQETEGMTKQRLAVNTREGREREMKIMVFWGTEL